MSADSSASTELAGAWHTKLRQTYAVAAPSLAGNDAMNGSFAASSSRVVSVTGTATMNGR